MANLGNNVKTAFLKGLEALGKTASSLTDAAQQKLSEMNLETRRRELMTEIPKCVMQLWKDGVELPEALNGLLSELADLEAKIAVIHPQPEPKAEEPAEEAEEPAEEEPAEEPAEEPEAEEEQPCEEAPAEEIAEEPAEEPACECTEACCCEAAAEPEAKEEA